MRSDQPHDLLRQPSGSLRALTRHELGSRAELAVADFLFVGGFLILARNLRLGALELDIVARRQGLVVVTEVRTRGYAALVRAFESVTRTKRARLGRAVDRLWRSSLSRMPGVVRVRIDVAAVTFAGGVTRVEYVEGALAR
jgi:putative endonuclease